MKPMSVIFIGAVLIFGGLSLTSGATRVVLCEEAYWSG